MTTSFFYNIFPILFFILFWNHIIRLENNAENIYKSDIIKFIFLALLIGFSNNYMKVITIVAVSLFLIFSRGINKIKFNHLFAIWGILLSSIIAAKFALGTITKINNYGYDQSFLEILNDIVETFIPFTKEFSYQLLNDFGIYIFLFFFLFIIMFLLNCKNIKELKFSNYIPLIIFFSTLITHFLLIFIPSSVEFSSFARLYHNDLVLEVKLVLIYIIFMQFALIYKPKFWVNLIIIIFLCTFSFFSIEKIITNGELKTKNDIIDYLNYSNNERKALYIFENINLFILKNNLPKPIVNEYSPDVLSCFYDFLYYYLSFNYKFVDREESENLLNRETIFFETYDECLDYYYSKGMPRIHKYELEKLSFKLLKKKMIKIYDK